ncbi:MAG: DNA-3-methyladenine glycosylase [Candidatus Gottesmanbacteria bacterium GW2011_GWA1_47_8]|uniref:DNA-3-methyladenine glycosylase II n=1 Tax=Candidatus Gottesmanbacteria bacterium GW2011_GWA1_47_8 TaxID=1618438 RepID=A0A0G1VSL8_9BACT|nr:MAG: DNA-3-methyladenine glycosylase [Candidatus Gottesmanbacteria bacterium GW2011_GWA1_47_8]
MNPAIKKYFKSVDPILFSVINHIESFELVKYDDYFVCVCREIIGQQLSGKVADVIYERFLNLFPKKIVTPQQLLKLPDKKIRAIGTSWSKVSYIKDLALKIRSGEVNLKTIAELGDKEVIRELSKVKGIGSWTAEMFLMFTLGREDVFSYGDLGLRRAIQKLYKFKKEPTVKQMEKIVIKWKPYRTYAARILWKSLE